MEVYQLIEWDIFNIRSDPDTKNLTSFSCLHPIYFASPLLAISYWDEAGPPLAFNTPPYLLVVCVWDSPSPLLYFSVDLHPLFR